MLEKKNGLKIAHVVASLKVGGAERFVIDLCHTQKREGEQPMIISLGKPGESLESECDSNDIPFYSSSRSAIIKLIQVFIHLKKVDIVHIHSPHALKFIQMIVPFLQKKIIYTRHGAAPLKAKHWKRLHVKIQSFVKAATFVSQEGMENFQNMHHWPQTKSRVIDNGVLINPINAQIKETVNLRIGSVGRMIPLKNQLGLLKALAKLPEDIQKNIDVHFFGDGECGVQLRGFSEKNLPNVDIAFHGMVNDRVKIYSSFDVLAVCSETEGLSMVIIEAMANKIPVIASNVGGNPKLVINDKTGWLFEYDDDKKLAEIIQLIIDERKKVNFLGESAFIYISENFSIDASAKKYAEVYES